MKGMRRYSRTFSCFRVHGGVFGQKIVTPQPAAEKQPQTMMESRYLIVFTMHLLL
jgi:hypothetical protein